MTSVALRLAGKADAYLEWALQNQFQYYQTVAPAGQARQAGLLIKWSNSSTVPRKLPTGVEMAGLYAGEDYAALSVAFATLLAKTPETTNFYNALDRLELATPLASDNGLHDKPMWESNISLGPALPLVLGCIDDGFALASRELFTHQFPRVRYFWNQDTATDVAGNAPGLSIKPLGITDFGYGKELTNQYLIQAKPIGGNAISGGFWQRLKNIFSFTPLSPTTGTRIRAHLPTYAQTNNDRMYYESVHMKTLRRHATHGAHVLSLFAGVRNPKATFPASAEQPAGTLSENAPIVLVQLPKYAIDDPSGRWLGRNVLDGLHYIVANAARHLPKTDKQKVVINLSWGPQTGPHDGTSLLEEAMDALVTSKAEKQDIHIVLPAGNSFLSRAHAQWPVNEHKHLLWVIPPNTQTPSFLEVWWPKEAGSTLTLSSPAGSVLITANAEGVWTSTANNCWVVKLVHNKARSMALIAIAPTGSHMPAINLAPHGRWQIKICAIDKAQGLVDAYIARSDHNMGASRRTKASYLWDTHYEQARRKLSFESAPIDVPHSIVKRSGTLNGIATGTHTVVAAGYRLSDSQPARYSSSGAVGSAKTPTCAYPTDISRKRQGIFGSGVRLRSVVKLVGTSAAAPQLAREIANAGALRIPTPAPPDQRLGSGCK